MNHTYFAWIHKETGHVIISTTRDGEDRAIARSNDLRLRAAGYEPVTEAGQPGVAVSNVVTALRQGYNLGKRGERE